ncbi:hypothetical protein FRB94_004255 [Tulasnella sp. JGI-2019a]|nr:hypothetical protein FRB93_000255 [Tulasnella sp. JGI-2019a]KAG9015136.1 hypothetical protein FRB94_004255 [Tulasnella sp. JGI-2019a]KAG9039205.1 hypothetical protein FRB95_011790 [Tulasnella sp. JGI-2019a]
MRLTQAFQLFAAFASLVAATPLPELEIAAVASFPDTNPFAHVVNGEKNKMTLEIENKSHLNVTLKSAAGSIHDPDSGKLLKNTTSLSYGVTLISGAKTVLPYNFNSEYKPKEVLLKIWVNYDDGSSSGPHRTMAYDSVVTIVEPPSSFFDLPLLLSYAVLAAILGGTGYLVFNNYAPKSVKKAIKKQRIGGSAVPPVKSEISEPVGTVKASSASGAYEEEWIPAHHKPKVAKKEGGLTSASSGEESGPERKTKRKSSRRG